MQNQVVALSEYSAKLTYSEKSLSLLAQMTMEEKIGQMCQVSGEYGQISHDLAENIRAGKVGSVINEVEPNTLKELQHIAVHQTRLGIPLLFGRDVIHGFKTIFPIPIGQAASWSPELVKEAASIAAFEASNVGINWTFAPMIDISRDPRWGRIAESMGEDPMLCSVMGAAMVKGFQGENLCEPTSIAACAKHFVGYGASESGRDYCTTNIPENELRNIYLPPFHAAAKAGVCTFMSSFSDLDGIPASGNKWLLKDILRDEWRFNGFVVSDWESVSQLQVHGVTENDKGSAELAFDAGVDMEMVSKSYSEHLQSLIDENKISEAQIDTCVLRILETKFSLGLFEEQSNRFNPVDFYLPEHLATAKELAIKSCVLLQNKAQCLPLCKESIKRLAVIGPLADDGYEQLGTWVFDGEAHHSVTLLDSLKSYLPEDVEILASQGLKNSRSTDTNLFDHALQAAHQSDAIILCLGEESILSGEAHCRSDISLPGAQHELIDRLSSVGKPIVLVIMAGRPLTIEPILEKVDSILFAWHPGTMAGPALTDIIFGEVSPSGKLPVTFPRVVGQIPIYYNQKHGGKPATNDNFVHMNNIPQRAEQTSLGMAATHLDTHFTPLFEFGYGLSYTQFEYSGLQLNSHKLNQSGTLTITATLSNVGECAAEEVVQLYVRDLVGSVTRPVKELKQFQRLRVEPKTSTQVEFELNADELAFYARDNRRKTELGRFHLWVGGSSAANLRTEFELISD
ncbi:glycoside hydrolase family 3 N-terminal domain-containing protein [Aliiglaciecola sp. M165]|uniref:glycoside hydrolase family 3 N-terminal domain-containing protein n=1 Tax=Aliiglaciecola sp. M165 TaxID=2593649 RepID=UPI0021B0E116|nr:glycoside hydrolase family 3 N-terminal domain-containing protein [Aliiglaciecola sp. M165]